MVPIQQNKIQCKYETKLYARVQKIAPQNMNAHIPGAFLITKMAP